MTTEPEILGRAADQPVGPSGDAASPPGPRTLGGPAIAPQQLGCPTCGGMGLDAVSTGGLASFSFVYAIGHVEARFPNLAAEREFAQVTGRTDTAGKTD